MLLCKHNQIFSQFEVSAPCVAFCWASIGHGQDVVYMIISVFGCNS